MNSIITKFKPVVVQCTSKHTASVIILHGSGSNGPDMREWIKMCFLGQDMVEPHIRFIYPTAPQRPYSAANGMISNVWFDRKDITPAVEEQSDSMDETCKDIDNLIDIEIKNGIPRNRIVIGGFSMGGALSLYYGTQYGKDLAGIFCLSSFLAANSKVYKHLSSTNVKELPPIYQAHGQEDELVFFEWGKRTNERLSSLGVNAVFKEYPSLYHQLSTKEIKDLRQWLLQHLPASA